MAPYSRSLARFAQAAVAACRQGQVEVDGADISDPDEPAGPPVLDAWVRFPDLSSTDPYLHTGLLAQFTGRLSIAAALRPHQGIGQHEVHRTLSTAVNAISLSLHREIRADRWMLLPPPLDLRG